MPPRLRAAMAAAIEELRNWPRKSVRLLHHNDADGLTAGALLTRAFERAGFAVQRLCLEKTYEPVLAALLSEAGGVIVFADFGGRIAPLISELNQDRNLVLILDHHKAPAFRDALLHNLNPELFGLAGDRDISASTTCYLFAAQMDPANLDLAALATIGAVGDGFFAEGRLTGLNREAAQAALRQGRLEMETRAGVDTYHLKSRQGLIRCETLATDLDTLGAVGYYRNGPEMGIRVCLDGPSPVSDRMVADLAAIRSSAYRREMERLKGEGVNTTAHLQWFHVGRRFDPMGVKMIGAFCDHLKDSDLFDPGRFIAGFQTIPDMVPGFGSVALDQVKISMRVSAALRAEIRAGRRPGLDTFLPEATGRVGGFADACHSLAAATTIPAGQERALIHAIEQRLAST